MESAVKQVACVGIDISKDFFDVALPAAGKYRHLQLGNDQEGFAKLLQQLKEMADCRVVMEASGPYYLRLASFLHAKGVSVSVVNPLVIRRFCQMRLTRAKTDKKDAVMIALYGQAEQPAPWEPEAAHVLEIRQLQSAAEGLQKTLHQHSRQLEALGQAPHVSRQARQSLERMVMQAQEELGLVHRQMELLITEHHGQLYEQVKSIPGLGKKSSLLLILITGGFKRFAHHKQLVSYLGLSPRYMSRARA